RSIHVLVDSQVEDAPRAQPAGGRAALGSGKRALVAEPLELVDHPSECRAAKVLIETVVDRSRRADQEGVIGISESEAPDDEIESRCLRLVVAIIADVGFVNEPSDRHERVVLAEVVPVEERFEAALAVVVGQLDVAHIEAGRIVGYLVRIVDEDELGGGIDEPADEPCAGGAIDVTMAPGRPSHRPASTSSWRSAIARSAIRRSGGGKKSRH